VSALGLDAGGTACRYVWLDRQGHMRRGEVSGFSGHVFTPEGRARAEAGLKEIGSSLGPGLVSSVHAGITGLSPSAPAAPVMADMIRAHFSARDVSIEGDGALAYRAAFAPGEGHLVLAGTGSVGVHSSRAGETTIIGGRGVILDDAGGGYWTAVQGLRHVMREEDDAPGRGFSSPLGRAFSARLGAEGWDVVRTAVYSGDRGSVGRLALAVVDAAHEQDETALAILKRAGAELSRLASVLNARFGQKPVSLVGRAAGMHPAIAEGFRMKAPEIDLSLPDIDPAQAAARYALSRV
jgi:glucosamine kinase